MSATSPSLISFTNVLLKPFNFQQTASIIPHHWRVLAELKCVCCWQLPSLSFSSCRSSTHLHSSILCPASSQPPTVPSTDVFANRGLQQINKHAQPCTCGPYIILSRLGFQQATAPTARPVAWAQAVRAWQQCPGIHGSCGIWAGINPGLCCTEGHNPDGQHGEFNCWVRKQQLRRDRHCLPLSPTTFSFFVINNQILFFLLLSKAL